MSATVAVVGGLPGRPLGCARFATSPMTAASWSSGTRCTPYDRPPLSKEFLAGTASLDDIALGTPDDADLDIEWRLGTTAVGLDHISRSVLLRDGSEVTADGVVLAEARARRLPGSEGSTVYTCCAPWTMRSLFERTWPPPNASS